ncbi:MFS transporter [Glutamicibacter uratoxydans]|uniref:MFS transporter n=2 Tax=Glutamicibacter uratoxydans TaxID=43667 RepID=A0A4Y4DQZ4_GLUUR|nr:MFS transporter [Glutamicibacter uratoxydans]
MPSSTQSAPPITMRNRIDRFFMISERRSTFATELRGGIATFFAMSYIVVLNPLVLSGADASGGELGVQRVAAVTALVSGVLTIIMGIWARSPFAMATGLGVNAFVAITVATNPELTWADVMGLVVIAGIVMFVLVLTGFRTAVFNAVPAGLKTAIVVGIGMFIALIGLVNAGFVQRIPDAAHTTVPVGLGFDGRLMGWPILVFIIGLLLTMTLVVRKVKGAILIGIVVSAVVANIFEAVFHVSDSETNGWSLVVPSMPSWHLPDLSLIGDVSLFGAFAKIGPTAASLLAFVILLSIFFDAMGTMVGLAAEADLVDENDQIPNVDKVLLVDAAGAIVGGGTSSSSAQIFVESGAGIGEGARTGLASVFTGLLMIVAMFLSPLIYLVPFEAVAPALVVVGFMMITQITKIDWNDWGVALPAFLTFTLMPFTYSIANGIGAGFISYVFIRATQGRAKEIHPLMWVVATAFVLFFGIGLIEDWAGVA